MRIDESKSLAKRNVVCGSCAAVNRVPVDRLSDSPICGRCKESLLPGEPIELNDKNFRNFVEKNDLPVVIDFWAPWCGPCKVMAPHFASAAKELNPQFILAKLNTQDHPELASPFNIAGIPTMILFQGGREMRRTSGAMQTAQIVRWIRS